MARMQAVGVVGLGRMGNPIAHQFMKSEFELLVWDTLPAARAPFENREDVRVADFSQMAARCAVIFLVLPSFVEVAQCLKGKEGILRNAGKRLVLYDLTTSDPIETRKNARRASRYGVPYLDAGMSGGIHNIKAANLSLLIGGDPKVLRRTRKYLTPFVDRPIHLGKLGSGHTLKLLNNMVLHTTFLATCEAARLCERMGIKVGDMIDVFNGSSAASYATRHRFPNNILNGSWNGGARIYNLHKDVGTTVRLGQHVKAHLTLADQTYEFLKRAVARGMIDEDLTLLYRDLDQIHETSLKKVRKRGDKGSDLCRKRKEAK